MHISAYYLLTGVE